MTREAFDLSERFEVPVMVRLVTRLAHARGVVHTGDTRPENPLSKPADRNSWVLLPSNARRQWRSLLDRQGSIRAWAEQSAWNRVDGPDGPVDLAVLTTGIARNYFLESAGDLAEPLLHLHVGAYPLPQARVRGVVARARRILVLEDGYPLVERQLRGVLPSALVVEGRESGAVPPDGELTPDLVRRALGLEVKEGLRLEGFPLPTRPPQLCQGCPHGDSYHALQQAMAAFDKTMVASDIGCYTLGALPPYSTIESCVCMGASIGMAKGAAEAGYRPAVAVIGDSTFLHSGLTALVDCVAANTDMTLVILDNETVGMTGGQPTMVPSSRLQAIVLGIGVDPEHFHVLDAHPRQTGANADVLRRELAHPGLSVVILVRECIETARARKAQHAASKGQS
jgi:indolepyruvate ferredoxin oxidoreductase, alpha subunit